MRNHALRASVVRSSPRRGKGFTLLEMIVAFTILALFVLPMLEIIAAARIRAVKYTRDRVVRDLAQRKLFERIYSIETMDEGNFEAEGHPDWTWEVLPPEMMNQGTGDQFLLQFTIRVMTPHALAEGSASTTSSAHDPGGGAALDRSYGGMYDGVRPAFEMSAWTFPSQQWLDELTALEAQGIDTGLYGTGVMPAEY